MEPKGNDMAGDELRKAVGAAIFDPGATEGFKGDRTVTEWQIDAVMRAFARLSRSTSTEAVAVKALEWKYSIGAGGVWQAYSILGKFTVADARWMVKGRGYVTCESDDLAKKSAQVYYEDRIRSALACPSPQGAVPFGYFDAWRKRAIDAEGQLGHVYDPTTQPYDEPFRHPSLQGGAEPVVIDIEALCKPWEFGAGDPPDYESPLTGVYTAGISYAFDRLAGLLNVHDYTGSDGAGTLEGDVCGTLQNILVAAGFVDKNGDLTHSLGETGGADELVGLSIDDIEAIVLATESESDQIWTRRVAVRLKARVDAALTSLRAERDAARGTLKDVIRLNEEAYQALKASHAEHFKDAEEAYHGALAAEKLKTADLERACAESDAETEMWAASSRQDELARKALEQRVAALVGALTTVHNWLANSAFDEADFPEALSIDDLVQITLAALATEA